MFTLANELRNLRNKLKLRELTFNTEEQPIYLHITTDGGDVFAAFSMVDCIKSLDIPVYSVVDGLVASAGTIISVAAKKKYIRPNAYMLVHELSSYVWGKMSYIEEQVSNLKKIMTHITDLYLEHTSIKEKELKKILLTDITWNAEECIKKGIADEIYYD
jgi:ATP-dependent Clp protease protease subunit